MLVILTMCIWQLWTDHQLQSELTKCEKENNRLLKKCKKNCEETCTDYGLIVGTVCGIICHLCIKF